MAEPLQLALNHALAERRAYINRSLSTGHALDDKRRNAWKEYGYPSALQFDDFFNLYERHGVAHGVVSRLTEKCWETLPRVIEGDEFDDKRPVTAWEKEFNALAKRLRLWNRFMDADRRRLVGHYSGLLLQVADSKRWDQSITGKAALVRVIPAWEGQLKATAWDENSASPTYGDVTMWQYEEAAVEPNPETSTHRRSVSVHPSRVVVVGDYRDGVPFLKAGYNDFVNLEKILGGSGESFLKNAARQIAVEYDKDVDLGQIARDYGVSPTELQTLFNEAARDLNQGLDVLLSVQGGKASALVAAVPDPEPHFNVALQSACASVRIPSKIVVGNQTGERASTEDLADFNKRCQGRRLNVLDADIETLVNHLMQYKLLSPVPGGEFAVIWDDLTESSALEKLEQAGKMADINQKMTGGGEPVPFSSAEIRDTAGYDAAEGADEPLPDVEPEDEDAI